MFVIPIYTLTSGGVLGGTVDTGLMPGAWIWFHDPRAVNFNGNTYIGAINSGGDVLVGVVPDGSALQSYYNLSPSFQVDDHANPSIMIRDSDSRIMAFYSKHDGTAIYQRISTNAEDITAWDSATNLDSSIGGNFYTYPNVIQLTGETNDPIYLFFRDRATSTPGSDELLSVSKSTNGGTTWTSGTAIMGATSTGSQYYKAVANGTARIDFCWNDTHPNEGNSSVYHFYYEGGSYYQTDGTEITGGLPFDKNDLTLVYDGSTYKSWVWDIETDGSGYPVIVYAQFQSTADHRYRYARWDGTVWNDYEIVAAGGPMAAPGEGEDYYSGGVILKDADNVYASIEVSGVHEIYKYTTADGGSSWGSVAITSGSSQGNYRPVVPRNYGGSIDVLWFAGNYVVFTEYNTNIFSSDT